MDQREEFLKRLTILAEICRHKLDQYQTALYDTALCSRGYDRLNKEISKIIETRKTNERFPSISDFRERIPAPQDCPYLPTGPHPAENSIFSKEEIGEICDMIKKRCLGLISAEQLNTYGQMIQRVVNERR